MSLELINNLGRTIGMPELVEALEDEGISAGGGGPLEFETDPVANIDILTVKDENENVVLTIRSVANDPVIEVKTSDAQYTININSGGISIQDLDTPAAVDLFPGNLTISQDGVNLARITNTLGEIKNLGKQAQYVGTTASIANGASGATPWSLDEGDALLDLSDAAKPALLADGLYALTITAATGALTANGFYQLRLSIDRGLSSIFSLEPQVAIDPATELNLHVTFVGEAGDKIVGFIDNNDGSSARIFTHRALLVKIG